MPKHGAAANERSASNGNESATGTAAFTRPEEPAESDPGCDKGQENRKSDLCAQWKAADAAQEAADFAKWATFIGLAGTALLIWTLLETRLATRRELRAYLDLDDIKFSGLSVGKKMVLNLGVENKGATPAYVLNWKSQITLLDHVPTPADFHIPEPNKKPSRATVGARGQIHLDVPTALPIPQDMFDRIHAGEVTAYAHGLIEYKDTFKQYRWMMYRLYFDPSTGLWMHSSEGNDAT